MWDGHDAMGWWMLWGSILWVFFIVAIVFIAVKLAGTSRSDGPSSSHDTRRPPETPLEILRRRYASGEITRDEFEQMRRDLGDG